VSDIQVAANSILLKNSLDFHAYSDLVKINLTDKVHEACRSPVKLDDTKTKWGLDRLDFGLGIAHNRIT